MRTSKTHRVVVGFLAAALMTTAWLSAPASAQQTTSPKPAPANQAPPDTPDNQDLQHEKRIKELEEQVDRLNRDTRQYETQIDTLTRYPLAQWKDGFFINSTDNRFKLKIG